MAVTLIVEDSGEYLAALDKRLFSTWAIRGLSASMRGRPGARSTSTSFRVPPRMKAFRASATRYTTSVGSGATDNAPASMRVKSRRLLMRSRRRSACSSMIRKNCRVSAGSNTEGIAEHGGGGALDRRQRRSQLVAHHAEELAERGETSAKRLIFQPEAFDFLR